MQIPCVCGGPVNPSRFAHFKIKVNRSGICSAAALRPVSSIRGCMSGRACLCGSRTHKNQRSRHCHLNFTQLIRHRQRGHHVLAAQEKARLHQLRLAVEAKRAMASTSVPAIAEIVPGNVSQGQVPAHLANTLRPSLLRTCVRRSCEHASDYCLNPRPPDPPTLTLSPHNINLQVTIATQMVVPVGITSPRVPLYAPTVPRRAPF